MTYDVLDQHQFEDNTKTIEQFPEYAQYSKDLMQDYNETIRKTVESNDKTMQDNHNLRMEIMYTLQNELNKGNISFDEKQYLIKTMMENAKEADIQDSENKVFLQETQNKAGISTLKALALSTLVIAGAAGTFIYIKRKLLS